MSLKQTLRRVTLETGDNGDLLADSHNILNRCENYFFLLLNVHRASDVRQIEILVYTAEPLVPDPSFFHVGVANAKYKKYKTSGSHQIQAKLIHAGSEI
jgi:hypothetical protein